VGNMEQKVKKNEMKNGEKREWRMRRKEKQR
jgi:hypothetical protein